MGIKLSYSSYQMYKTSPMSYYLHYIMKLRPDMYKGAFILGDCMDAAIGYLTNTKDVKGAKELFKNKFAKYETYLGKLDTLTSNQIQWTKTEGHPGDWLEVKADMAIDAYNEQVMPHFKKVHGTQIYTKIEDGKGNIIRGYADKIVTWHQDSTAANYNPELDKWNDKVILFDDKFSTSRYSIPDSEQLATYKEATNIDIDIDAQGYIVIPKAYRLKKEPLVPIKITIDKVLDSTVESVFKGYEDTLNGIKMGQFPCSREACERNPFGCQYKKYCDSHGEDLTGLVYVGEEDNDKSKGR